MSWNQLNLTNWLTWQQPNEMLEWIHRTGRCGGGESQRRGRLLCAHLCRCIQPHLAPLYSEYSFDYNMIPEAIENVAEGLDTEDELERLHGISVQIQDHYEGGVPEYALFDIINWSLEEFYGIWVPATAINSLRLCGIEYDIVYVCDLIRELYQPNFQLDRGQLTDGVIDIAQSIYDDRRFDELSILADAMEEIGYKGMILNHLRSSGGKCRHVLGCWALDSILDKE